MAIFKPQKLDWDDIDGGLGEQVADEINNFIGEHCYEPRQYDSDENLPNELAEFAERWDHLEHYDRIADTIQVSGVLSLINGAFYSGWAFEKIMEALLKSATKPELLKIVVHVACAYCEYVSLKCRVEAAGKEI